MNNTYEKPVVLANEELAEGVYAASGAGSDCYTVTAYIHQRPETGRETYAIQVNAVHAATHHSTAQELVLYFNMPVTYVASQGSYKSGSGTSELHVSYTYHNNNTENIGLGDVYVTCSDYTGLSVTGAQLICNMTCAQHG